MVCIPDLNAAQDIGYVIINKSSELLSLEQVASIVCDVSIKPYLGLFEYGLNRGGLTRDWGQEAETFDVLAFESRLVPLYEKSKSLRDFSELLINHGFRPNGWDPEEA